MEYHLIQYTNLIKFLSLICSIIIKNSVKYAKGGIWWIIKTKINQK